MRVDATVGWYVRHPCVVGSLVDPYAAARAFDTSRVDRFRSLTDALTCETTLGTPARASSPFRQAYRAAGGGRKARLALWLHRRPSCTGAGSPSRLLSPIQGCEPTAASTGSTWWSAWASSLVPGTARFPLPSPTPCRTTHSPARDGSERRAGRWEGRRRSWFS